MPEFGSFRREIDQWRGLDFWMLNDALDEEQMRFELEEMRRQGVAAVIARTYIGLKSDYPGKDFKRKLRLAVECARELGMKICLQAAYMPEAVPNLPEEYTAGCMKETEPGVYAFCRTEYYIDMFNPEAVRHYLQYVYADVWQDFRDEFGKTIFSAWVDEPSYSREGLPWNGCLVEEYRRMWNCEPEVAPLFHEMPGCGEARFRYWNTVVRLLEKSYFRQLNEFCHSLGLEVSGHLMGEGSFHLNFGRAAAMMPFYRYFDLPGIDTLTAEMYYHDSPLTRLNDDFSFPVDPYTTVRQCVSAARQAGKKRILCEMYGVTSENLALRDQIHLFNRFAVSGINCRSVHGLFYSLRGRGKRAYPPHVNYYQPYWKHYHHSIDECAFNSWFISQGETLCDVLVMLPWNTATTMYAKGELPRNGIQRLRRLELQFLEVEKVLGHNRIAFDLGDEFLLEDCGRVQDGRIFCGACSYRAVVLPYTEKLADSTLRLLAAFAAQGGTVLALGKTACPEAEQLSGLAELQRRLAPFRSMTLECDDTSAILMRHAREDSGEECLFLFNSDCGNAHAVNLPCPASELKSDGTLGVASTRFVIAEGGALRLVLRKDALASNAPESPVMLQNLPDSWHFRKNDPNALLLEFCRFKRESDAEYSHDLPLLAVHEILTQEGYSGDVTLRFEFVCRGDFPRCRLALENPEQCQVLCDGVAVNTTSAGYFAAREFETLELPPLGSGTHLIEIRRYFTPLQKPAKGVTELFENLKGVELEMPFLIGDFALDGMREPTRCPGVVRMNRDFTLVPEPLIMGSELTASGYPFFAGSATLSQEFECGVPGEDASLRIAHLNAAAVKVTLNGIEQGVIYGPPCRLPLSGMRLGKNTLELEITGTLRNLLGPFHRPQGEYGECFGGYGFPNKNWIGAVDNDGNPFPDWHLDRTCDTSAWCESYMQVPFGLSGVSIECRRKLP